MGDLDRQSYRDHLYAVVRWGSRANFSYINDNADEIRRAKKDGATVIAQGMTLSFARSVTDSLNEGAATANPPKSRARRRYTVGERVVVSLRRDVYFGQEGTVTQVAEDGGLAVHLDGGARTFFSPKDVRPVGNAKGRVKKNPFVTILNPRGVKAVLGDPMQSGAWASEGNAWAFVAKHAAAIKGAKLTGVDQHVVKLLAMQIQQLAQNMKSQLNQGVHTNPPPGVSHDMGAVTEIRYVHSADGDHYKHIFPKREGRPHLMALKDGSLHIWSPRGRVL